MSGRVSAAAAALGQPQEGGNAAARTRALWRVFREFGTAYRRQRRESGARPIPGVRDAAEAFRRDPTMISLVAVASALDEHGLMERSA
ncbi:MAG TPA: hypothetical protein VFM14_15440 [Gemmatimonadales bacterium]|nr:hypothetical protein [Gemmatimonadales bacterium]